MFFSNSTEVVERQDGYGKQTGYLWTRLPKETVDTLVKLNQGGKTGSATGEGGATTHGWFAGYFQLNNKLYTLVVVTPNINGVDEDGNELGGGSTAAPIYREIIKTLMQ